MTTARVVPSGGTSLLLEREVQVSALQALVDAAKSGAGRFVVVEGSAGIGKTRLLAKARAIAGSAEMGVLAARGGELEGEFAYGIVRQLFEPLVAVAAPELRAELLAGPAARIASLVGAAQPAGSQDAAPEGAFAVVHGLYWLAANVALHRPDAAGDRRPALGRQPLVAVAAVPDATAGGRAAAGRCGDPAARGRGPRSQAGRRAGRRSGGCRGSPRAAWAWLDRGAGA
jgi:hypothetical protein